MTAPLTPREAAQRLSEIAPSPRPGEPVTARQLAAWIAVDAQRAWHRNRPVPGLPDWPMGELRAFVAGFAAVHALMWLGQDGNGNAGNIIASQVTDAIADGQGAGEWLDRHLRALGIDPAEVSKLEDQLQAASEPCHQHGGTEET